MKNKSLLFISVFTATLVVPGVCAAAISTKDLGAVTTNSKYKPSIPDNTLLDATQWTSTAVGPSPTGTSSIAAAIFGKGAGGGVYGAVWLGGLIKGSIPTTWDWTKTHSFAGVGVVIYNNGPAEWSHLRVHNVEDGIKSREVPEYSNTASWFLHDCYMTAIRDDAVEDDRFEPGTVQDCLFDGVHTFISEQNENVDSHDPIGSGESNTIYVKRSYVRIYPTNNTSNEDNPGGGKWFKWQGRGVENHKVVVSDSVFAVGAVPRSGWKSLSIPSQVSWAGSNNFILWLGTPGAYRGPKPTGVKFLEGKAASDKWIEVREQWLFRHGLPPQGFEADYNPHKAPLQQIPVL